MAKMRITDAQSARSPSPGAHSNRPMEPGARHPLYRRMMRLLGTAVSRRATTRIHRLAVPDTREARDISERVNQIDWYQAIELPHGVVTPGRADHRDQVSRYGLPEDMSGMRALDVATFDGFWAFEMERRGAEVVAIDIGRWSDADIPARWLEEMKPEQDAITGDGFRLARELLGSRVDRREINVYDLDPDQLGAFDVVMMSDLLLHIRDPQRALERLFEVTAPGGYAIIAEPYDQRLDRITNGLVIQLGGFETRVWSIPSSRALKFMVKLAGFDPVEELSRFRLNYDHPFAVQKVVLKGYRDESRVPRRVQVQAGSKNGR